MPAGKGQGGDANLRVIYSMISRINETIDMQVKASLDGNEITINDIDLQVLTEPFRYAAYRHEK